MHYFVGVFFWICGALVYLHVFIGPAEAKRVALVIGIDTYDNLSQDEQLGKAVSDAQAMGGALRELGFETNVEENVPRMAFMRAWQRFLNQLDPGDTAAFSFSGHGVEIGGLNYLLPRDVPKVQSGEDKILAEAAIRFNGLMEDLREKRVRIALFVVDACRDNPFRDGRGRSVGSTRGLTRVEPPRGSFVIYSAGVGERALDRLSEADRNPNSPFMRALLPILKTPGLSLPEIASRVRLAVVELVRKAQPPHEQMPAYYDQIMGGFFLKEGPRPSPKSDPEPAPKIVIPPPKADPVVADFEFAERINSREVWEEFLAKHPTGMHAAAARRRLAALTSSPEAIETVRSFYLALASADGTRASSLVVPEKRAHGPFNAAEITKFYSSLAEPLRLTNLIPVGEDKFQAEYTYRVGKRTCNGSAVVTIVRRDNHPLIEAIKAKC